MAERVTICVVSSGRADYGLIRPIVDALRADPRTRGQLLLTGTHADNPRLGLVPIPEWFYPSQR